MVKKRKRKPKTEVLPESPAPQDEKTDTFTSDEIQVLQPPQTIVKSDPRYEILKEAVTDLVKERPETSAVHRNPMLYHEWALKLERLLQ